MIQPHRLSQTERSARSRRRSDRFRLEGARQFDQEWNQQARTRQIWPPRNCEVSLPGPGIADRRRGCCYREKGKAAVTTGRRHPASCSPSHKSGSNVWNRMLEKAVQVQRKQNKNVNDSHLTRQPWQRHLSGQQPWRPRRSSFPHPKA